jgi:hypothetical protein
MKEPCALLGTSLDEDRAITRGLMKLSERCLARILENEPDIYTLEDLTSELPRPEGRGFPLHRQNLHHDYVM